MGYKTLCFGFSCILFAYCVYSPLPENIEEPWRVRLADVLIKITSLVATLFENIGLMKYEGLFSIIATMHFTKPVSDENVTVIDTNFSDIPVRLYLPKRKSERQRPAVIHIHGGGFVLGSYKVSTYDDLNRWTANKLNAVVVGIDYRLAPQYPFPVALEDCIFVIKFFLQDKVLAEYGVDTTRICIMGDSSGGTLAATVVQLLQNDPEYKDRIKAQALIYPVLQLIDTLLPSHREYEHGPLLYREVLIKLICLYVTEDKTLLQAALRNEHMPEGSRHLFKFVNWSDFLPEKFKKNHVYTEPVLGKLNDSYPALVDSRMSPSLASDSQLQNLPLTYIVTCEHDLLRDDGLMYVTRLRNVGVPVTHDHIEKGIHGAMSLTRAPVFLHLGLRIRDRYISWLKENL
ncbi:arylacetamide deacetylase-like 2 [Peromyscus californicus insignis]|uniref:arylacetamide deacetylase-like 2 n=1 Tax=Peromyscus californicus insignis TaxID=564181 RepID=UPI0022A6B993|nr:arylacetamide deacetylase-like 2 [Peromyscus californicus insignis]